VLRRVLDRAGYRPEPSGPDPVIKPPASVRPIAPAIKPEPTGPDPTIDSDRY
jgi:hypothetical protein